MISILVYHFVMGGFAFGMVFMATDPVSSAHTNKGRWIYGFINWIYGCHYKMY